MDKIIPSDSLGLMIEPNTGLGALWAALLASCHGKWAPVIQSLGIRSVHDLATRANEVTSAGVPASDLESILAQVTPSMPRDMDGRRDHPVLIAHEGRASIQLALNAALPNQRKRSLELLDRDILSRSTRPSQESRLKTFLCLCTAWEVPAYPLSPECIRCVGASLKAGAYRSAGLYFQAAVAHQLRFYQQPVSPFIRAVIRDVTRSIKRGLGPASVKKGFNLVTLSSLVDPEDDRPFDIDSVAHITDMMIIGSWFMLRELEISFARDSHLCLHGNEVHLLVPVHKTSTQGSLTVRVLQCACSVQMHPLCPWHATERHLVRVLGHPRRAGDTFFPLFADSQGKTMSKYLLIQAFRKTLQSAGIATQVQDAQGKQQDIFGGHCLRVTGAQFLACAGWKHPSYNFWGDGRRPRWNGMCNQHRWTSSLKYPRRFWTKRVGTWVPHSFDPQWHLLVWQHQLRAHLAASRHHRSSVTGW